MRVTRNPRLVLVRHGATAWSEEGRHTGRTDVPLTPAGEDQARRLPALLGALALARPLVVCSPRARARSTARLAGLGAARTDPLLAEWDYGEYEGVTTERIRTRVPGWTVFTHPCPGGETAEEVLRRADAVLSGLVAPAHAAGRDVILVGHGHFSRVLVARWLDAGMALAARVAMPTAGVAELGHERETRAVLSMSGPRLLPRAPSPPPTADAAPGSAADEEPHA